MKALSYEETTARIREFNEYLEQERVLQEELLGLQLHGPSDLVAMNRKRHDTIIAEIQELRMEKMIPILTQIAESVQEYRRQEALGLLRRREDAGG